MGTGRIDITSLELEEECHWNNDHRSFRESGKILECRNGEIWDYGGSTGVPIDEVCPRCRSTGRIPTALGWEILEFVRDYADWKRH